MVLGLPDLSNVHSSHHHDPSGATEPQDAATEAACMPRAENVGDFIPADHKVLSEGCESRNNHRYAVVVQDLATQWLQSYPC